MQAVVLAAGKGKRLQPLTLETPKAMVLVNNTPLLELIINRLVEVNAKDITIIVNYLKEKIINYFGNGEKFNANINYVVQKEIKGDGNALLYAESFITDNKFLVVACDKLIPKNYLNNIIDNNYDGVMSVRKVKDGRMYGVILHENKLIKQIIEKSPNPPTNLANASMYYLPKDIFSELKELKEDHTGEYRIVYAVQSLINKGKKIRYEFNDDILDIGNIEKLEKAKKLAVEWELCRL